MEARTCVRVCAYMCACVRVRARARVRTYVCSRCGGTATWDGLNPWSSSARRRSCKDPARQHNSAGKACGAGKASKRGGVGVEAGTQAAAHRGTKGARMKEAERRRAGVAPRKGPCPFSHRRLRAALRPPPRPKDPRQLHPQRQLLTPQPPPLLALQPPRLLAPSTRPLRHAPLPPLPPPPLAARVVGPTPMGRRRAAVLWRQVTARRFPSFAA